MYEAIRVLTCGNVDRRLYCEQRRIGNKKAKQKVMSEQHSTNSAQLTLINQSLKSSRRAAASTRRLILA